MIPHRVGAGQWARVRSESFPEAAELTVQETRVCSSSASVTWAWQLCLPPGARVRGHLRGAGPRVSLQYGLTEDSREEGTKALGRLPESKQARFLEGSLCPPLAGTQCFLQSSPQPHERLTAPGGKWPAQGHPASWWQSQGPNYPWHHVDLTLVWPHWKGLPGVTQSGIGREELDAWIPRFP